MIRVPFKGGYRDYIGIIEGLKFRVSQNQGYHFGGSYNKDYSILGSILRFPSFRETTISVCKLSSMHQNEDLELADTCSRSHILLFRKGEWTLSSLSLSSLSSLATCPVSSLGLSECLPFQSIPIYEPYSKLLASPLVAPKVPYIIPYTTHFKEVRQ